MFWVRTKRRAERVPCGAESAVSDWAREALGFAADQWQAELLDSGARWVLLCCSPRHSREVTRLCSFRLTHSKIGICRAYAWWV